MISRDLNVRPATSNRSVNAATAVDMKTTSLSQPGYNDSTPAKREIEIQKSAPGFLEPWRFFRNRIRTRRRVEILKHTWIQPSHRESQKAGLGKQPFPNSMR